MDLQSIADFIALAEKQSFSRAAKARNITQPAFSRRIRALEEDLMVKLVDRETTPVTLTSAGQHFLRHAQSLAGLGSAVVEDMRSLATQLPQALHILASNSLSSIFFPSWYRSMQRKVKGLSFRVSHQRSEQSLDDLRTGRADFALHMMAKGVKRTYNYSGILKQTIGRDRLVFVKAASAKSDTTSLMTHKVGSYMRDCLDLAVGPERLARMKVVFESPNSEFLRGMALAGFGAALLSENLVCDDMRDGYLVPALPDFKPWPSEVLLLRAERPLSAMGEALWKKCSTP